MINSSKYNISDITDYIILRLNSDEEFSLVNLKLQKLLYYTQAWNLGIKGQSLFDGKFEAWIHGPVNRTVYNRFKDTKSLYSLITTEDVLNKEALHILDKEDSSFVNYILENYAGCNGVELEAMTHSELPWIKARKGFSPTERCTNEISEQLMKEYYGRKWAEVNQ